MDNYEFKEKHKRLFTPICFVLTVFLVVLIASTVIDIQNKMEKTENTITVFATGEVYAKPDLAIATFTTINEAKTVTEAMSANVKKVNAVINAVKEQGVEDKDLKTTTFNIYPRYEWYDATTYPYYPQGRRVLVGYEINQAIQVKIRDMEKVGDIIQAATNAGANQVSDLQFTIDNQDELKKQAREEAIKEAKSKAEELASQLGIKLVRISNFSESGVVPRLYSLEKAAEGLGGGEAEELQIETGENKIEITVYITYEIR